MVERSTIELRTYLKSKRKSSECIPIPEFDVFLKHVSLLFRLRVGAEDNYKLNPHLAKNKTGALPLGWNQINGIIYPPSESPEESLVSQIAKECLSETEELLKDMRKVLVRQRDKVALGQVQQVDSHCLRWLTRQPGRNTLEKAGARQQILAIVRNESYNTLENRVFKDFIARTSIFAFDYLNENEWKFKDHQDVKNVRRLQNLCQKGFAMPVMDTIGDLFELPVPNYLLRQERRYFKIWKAYCLLVKQTEIAERLWKKKDEVFQIVKQLEDGIAEHINPLAKYESLIWFNVLDGVKPILDQPFWANELGHSPLVIERHAVSDVVVIDLAVPDPRYSLLIYGRHANAKPYLQNFQKPSIEDEDGEHWSVHEILNRRDENRLRDYFEQLKSILQGERWIVLVPDDWAARWQEAIIAAAPLSRDNVFLLWRSVAALIGKTKSLFDAHENDSVSVVDLQQKDRVVVSKLLLAQDEASGELIPQRKSFSMHPAQFGVFKDGEESREAGLSTSILKAECRATNHSRLFNPIFEFANESRHVIILGNSDQDMKSEISSWSNNQSVYSEEGNSLVASGVAMFCEKQKNSKISYFDELEALSLVVQTKMERVLAKELVKAYEKFPGGTEYVGDPTTDLVLRRGESKIAFYLHEGVPEANTLLKEYCHEFSRPIDSDAEIRINPRMTPGQGLALIYISAPFLRHALKVDLRNDIQDSDKTISIIESTMKRRFPPDMPFVVASQTLWEEVRQKVTDYLSGQGQQLYAGAFAKAQDYYGEVSYYTLFPLDRVFDPAVNTPIDKLKRENVFGNAPDSRYPSDGFDFQLLFQRLASDYTAGRNVTRLIAWTYQFDNPLFSPIKDSVLLRYEVGRDNPNSGLRPEEYSVCANLFSNQSERQRLFEVAIHRTIAGISGGDDLRLIYNLLQFYPDTVEHISSETCTKLMQVLKPLYVAAREMKNSKYRTQQIGYALKPMLFMLHRRRYDSEFFKAHTDWGPEWIRTPLGGWNRHESIRVAFIEYVNGRGTLEGIPTS